MASQKGRLGPVRLTEKCADRLTDRLPQEGGFEVGRKKDTGKVWIRSFLQFPCKYRVEVPFQCLVFESPCWKET